MANNTAFQPCGNTVALTTSGSINTSQSRQVTAANLGTGAHKPAQVRMYNAGTAIIWVSFTSATGTATAPTPGTTTAGTPQPGIFLIPGVVEVFTLPAGPALWVNDVSSSASQTYYISGGEGL